MMRKYLGVILIAIILSTSGLSWSETAFSDINGTHWAYGAVSGLSEIGIIDQTSQFGLGREIIELDYRTWLSRLQSNIAFSGLKPVDRKVEALGSITRKDAVKLLISTMGYGPQAERLQIDDNPFEDVVEDAGYVIMALDFGIITMNDAKLFRPNDSLTREEAAVLLSRLYNLYTSKMPHLLS